MWDTKMKGWPFGPRKKFRWRHTLEIDMDDIPTDSPKDPHNIVFFIFLLLGLGGLMPWNMFITAKAYFEEYKLSENHTVSTNTNYRGNFMQNVGFASQFPNLLFNWLNLFINFGCDLTSRLIYSILIEIVVLLVTVLLAMLESYEWPGIFFWVTMCTIVVINMCGGVYQSTIYGLAASLPPKYTGAVVLGANLSGCFATLMSMMFVTIFKSQRTSAIYYFVMAIVVLVLCIDSFLSLPFFYFYRYYEERGKQRDMSLQTKHPLNVPYWQIFKSASLQLFNVFITFFVTLAIFPAIYSDVKRWNTNFFIGERYFTLTTCFLTFNVFATLGSLLTTWIKWPNPSWLIVPAVLRIGFIPLMIMCNYRPKDIDRTLPVMIESEYIYWLIGILMSFSSGYISSLAMMYTPQTVGDEYQVKAGMFSAAFLMSGILCGILSSYLGPFIIQL